MKGKYAYFNVIYLKKNLEGQLQIESKQCKRITISKMRKQCTQSNIPVEVVSKQPEKFKMGIFYIRNDLRQSWVYQSVEEA